jgi:hypothetical protein
VILGGINPPKRISPSRLPDYPSDVRSNVSLIDENYDQNSQLLIADNLRTGPLNGISLFFLEFGTDLE